MNHGYIHLVLKNVKRKANARRSYNLPMNEDRMNWWIMNLSMVMLVVHLGWLNENDRFTWSWKDFLGHSFMKKKVEQDLMRKPWSICLTLSGYAKWDE